MQVLSQKMISMRFYMLFGAVLLVSSKCAAQDWSGEVYHIGQKYPGYYISNEGDTTFGYFLHGNQVFNQKNCHYYVNETDRKPSSKFKQDDIREYKVADKVYRSIHFSGGLLAKPLRFNLLVNDGGIAEYVFYDEDGSGNSQTVFHKAHDPNNDKPVTIDYFGLGFAKKVSAYVADFEELANKVKNKEKGYRMLKILDIFAEYNEWYANNNQ